MICSTHAYKGLNSVTRGTAIAAASAWDNPDLLPLLGTGWASCTGHLLKVSIDAMAIQIQEHFLTLGPNIMMPLGIAEGCEGTGCSGRSGRMGAWMPRRVCERHMAGECLKRQRYMASGYQVNG